MDEQLIQLLSQYGILGLLAYFSIKEFFTWLGKNKNGNGLNEIANKIANNDLVHILKEMEKQTEQHDKQTEVLIQIRTILQERK
ncbi:hypothetical protein M1146_05720 [Patescibacteria group bacterium]|nr:hypothetical protein [Patescibacteria group bacterium]